MNEQTRAAMAERLRFLDEEVAPYKVMRSDQLAERQMLKKALGK